MNKIITYVFSSILLIGLVVTCATGVRPIGKALYKYYNNIENYSGFDKVDNLISTVDDSFTNSFFIRDTCVDLYGLIQRIIGKDFIVDSDPSKTVLKGSDNKLYFKGNVTGDYVGEDAFENNINSVTELYKYCKDKNINFLYVNAPHKYNSYSVKLPIVSSCIDDYSEDSALFIKKLSVNGVPALDLMAKLKEDYSNYSDGFFITDHHWNIRTAFWGYSNICNKLNSVNKSSLIDPMYYDLGNYKVTTYKDSYLGSMGIRVGKYYVGKDDVDLISPKFPTDFTLEYESKTLKKKISRSGDFMSSLINGDISYSMYLTSDNSHIFVDNKLNSDGNNVLLLKDSFGIPVSAWISCWADELHILDLRYEQDCSVEDFINEKNIDTVIILYNPEVLESKILYNFTDTSIGR